MKTKNFLLTLFILLLNNIFINFTNAENMVFDEPDLTPPNSLVIDEKIQEDNPKLQKNNLEPITINKGVQDEFANEPTPDISIVDKQNATHYEHRIGGKLYLIKVVPKFGFPYYLIEREGNGTFERVELGDNITTPKWVLFSW